MGKMDHNRAVRERHRAEARIRELEASLDRAEARRSADLEEVDAKHELAFAEHLAELGQLKRRLEAELARISELESALAAKVEWYQLQLTSVDAILRKVREDRDAWRAKAEESEQATAGVTGAVADLRALLDRVRDRMTRKQREAESAILNRQALRRALLIPEDES